GILWVLEQNIIIFTDSFNYIFRGLIWIISGMDSVWNFPFFRTLILDVFTKSLCSYTVCFNSIIQNIVSDSFEYSIFEMLLCGFRSFNYFFLRFFVFIFLAIFIVIVSLFNGFRVFSFRELFDFFRVGEIDVVVEILNGNH
ncbi:hypothetical protein CANTEDRAFT_102695, partial [Yamadazyma tenuis ATCC 10573]